MKHSPRLLIPFLLLLSLSFLMGGAPTVSAQAKETTPSQPSPYWQFDAPGPIGLVAAADIDNNGIDEFVVTTEGYRAVLLDGTGRSRWTYSTPEQAPILELTIVNVDGAGDPHREILLATEDQLILLDRNKNVLWQKQLVLPPIPTELLADADGDTLEQTMNNRPATLTSLDRDDDGNEEILVLLQSGLVQLYTGEGNLIWQYPETPPVSDEPQPKLSVGDVDRDGREEILFSYYIRYSKILLLDSEGHLRWERSISGRTTALELVAWDDNGPLHVAIGNNFQDEQKRVLVYDADGTERWFRTPNRTVTDLATATLPEGRALLVGTDVGTVTAYGRDGRRFWRYLPESAQRSVVSISPDPNATSQQGQPALAFTLAPPAGEGSEGAAVVLLDDNGREVQHLLSASASGQTRLLDVNRDGISELILASFGTLSLTDPGTGARKNAQAWDYRLYAAPLSMIVADLNQDGEDELLVGTRDGQLHFLESDTGQASSIVNPGGEVAHLALVPQASDEETSLVVAAHNHAADDDSQRGRGVIELIRPSGRVVWPDAITIPGAVTSLQTGNINRDTATEIVVGTSEGELIAYSLGARELWRATIPHGIERLALVERNGDEQMGIVVANGRNEVYRLSGSGEGEVLAYYNLRRIVHLQGVPRIENDDRALLLATDDGLLRALTWQGLQPWQWQVPGGDTSHVQQAEDTFLVADDAGTLYNLDVRNDELLWRLDGLGEISALYWGDLDGGGSQDLAVGTPGGSIYLYTSDTQLWDSLSLSSSSSVFGLTGVRRGPERQAQLAVITDNGVVQLFEAKPNRPPLLINPRVEVGPGRYEVGLDVIEEPEDSVTVGVQVFDEARGQWMTQDETAASGSDNVFFSLAPEGNSSVQYRFTFSDGAHQGVVTAPVGPAPQPVNTLRTVIIAPVLVLLALFTVLMLVRQSISIEARARRFYRRLRQQPAATLALLAEQYRRTGGSPDFLLNLANRARLDHNSALANLADGLFLMSSKPGAAVSIINSALEEAETEDVSWLRLKTWKSTFSVGQALLEAPSVTELSLLRPQLRQLVEEHEDDALSCAMDVFLPVLTSLHDSERVDLVDDRLVYLHEAAVLLRQVGERAADQPSTVENQLINGIQERLFGLVNADIEMLRGQAQLNACLKTKRIIPEGGRALIVLEVKNDGRAAAENISVSVEEDPAYKIHSGPEVVPVLSPGRALVAKFELEPHTEDRLRVAFSIQYSDRSRRHRNLAFADMVHLLPPQRDFSPIPNPYMPGTPLRGNSRLFYGRENLFKFIAENAGQVSHRNVLILVGQRRTGKTSVLLRLEHHLPQHLLPIYIDCQSLGVLPGMPALFHDLAWHIADALRPDGYDVDVPPAAAWHTDPARLFQQTFLPAVREKLPEEATLLLVFDEFEAFENLVADDILPSTFFTYMRHLMQHSEGLSFVFVGTRRLEEMTSDYWSVLFNIALYRQIGFLDREAATKLITEPVAPNIVYDDLALDKIWRVTAGHPYFLQLVCYTLVKRANNQGTGYVTISDVNAALEEMLRLGEVHFAYLWKRSTYIERALLAAVAHLMDREVPFHPADLMQYLEKFGFRLDPVEVTTGLSHLVEREIMREITVEGTTLYELKVGLVGLWAAQNKSLSKLYERGNGRDTERATPAEPQQA